MSKPQENHHILLGRAYPQHEVVGNLAGGDCHGKPQDVSYIEAGEEAGEGAEREDVLDLDDGASVGSETVHIERADQISGWLLHFCAAALA